MRRHEVNFLLLHNFFLLTVLFPDRSFSRPLSSSTLLSSTNENIPRIRKPANHHAGCVSVPLLIPHWLINPTYGADSLPVNVEIIRQTSQQTRRRAQPVDFTSTCPLDVIPGSNGVDACQPRIMVRTPSACRHGSIRTCRPHRHGMVAWDTDELLAYHKNARNKVQSDKFSTYVDRFSAKRRSA
jgi:hypothetical protein